MATALFTATASLSASPTLGISGISAIGTLNTAGVVPAVVPISATATLAIAPTISAPVQIAAAVTTVVIGTNAGVIVASVPIAAIATLSTVFTVGSTVQIATVATVTTAPSVVVGITTAVAVNTIVTLFSVTTIAVVGGVSFAQGYVPPPVFPPLPPIQSISVSEKYFETLAASDQTRIVSIEVWKNNIPQAVIPGVTVGEVDVDVTQQIRRTCSVTVVSQGIEYDDWVPTNASSPLHPASGNELRIFRGFRYSDGTEELYPLGVFRMTKPVVTDTGDAITIDVTGNDRSALVSARKWTDTYSIQAGTSLAAAIENLIQNRIPDLDISYLFGPTYGLTVPATTFGLSLASGNDPFADATTLTVNAGMELFFDPNGNLILQEIPDPSKVDPSFLAPTIYSEGANATFVQVARTLDETATYNGVIVLGVGTAGAPVRAEVWDTDPSSPTYYQGPWGKQPYIYQTTLVPAPGSAAGAYSQALKIAQSLFVQVRTMLDTPTFECVPNPALVESNVILIQRARIGLNAAYGIAQMTIPLDVSSNETVTCRGRNMSFSPPNEPVFVLGAHGG